MTTTSIAHKRRRRGNPAVDAQFKGCGCKSHQDVFTYKRWRALGFQVNRGEHGFKTQTTAGPLTFTTVLFCRHQVKPRDAKAATIANGAHANVPEVQDLRAGIAAQETEMANLEAALTGQVAEPQEPLQGTRMTTCVQCETETHDWRPSGHGQLCIPCSLDGNHLSQPTRGPNDGEYQQSQRDHMRGLREGQKPYKVAS